MVCVAVVSTKRNLLEHSCPESQDNPRVGKHHCGHLDAGNRLPEVVGIMKIPTCASFIRMKHSNEISIVIMQENLLGRFLQLRLFLVTPPCPRWFWTGRTIISHPALTLVSAFVLQQFPIVHLISPIVTLTVKWPAMITDFPRNKR